MNRRIAALLLLPLLLAIPAALDAQQTGASRWAGQWTSPTGFLYLAEMRLEIGPGGAAEGAITYVRGRYDAASRVLALEGYRKEDPLAVIGLDTYRLLLAENGLALAGMTSNHGDWQGRFWATRVDRAGRP
jgi:hypothetical protein